MKQSSRSSWIRAVPLGALLVALPVVGGCFWDENSTEPERIIDSVSMSPSAAVMKVGQSINVVAKPITADGQPVFDRTYVWSSSDTAIVEAKVGGVVLAKKVGSAIVTATVDGTHKGNTQITVTP